MLRWRSGWSTQALGGYLAAVLVLGILQPGMAAAEDRLGTADQTNLTVCADPDNMPFSNQKGEGFENQLARLIGAKLGLSLHYDWIPQGQADGGVLPNDACDLVLGYVEGSPLIADTNPYYRTAYVLLYRQNDSSLAGLNSLNDPRLKTKQIGIMARTQPASLLAMNGLISNTTPFEDVNGHPNSAAEAIVSKIGSGALDAGILWGPLGGYYALGSKVPLALVPLVAEKAGPATLFDITMGIRPNEPQWKHRLNKVIAENQDEIYAILSSFGVPLLDENGKLIEMKHAQR